MSCPEKSGECSPPPAKQRKVLDTEEKNNGVLDLPDSRQEVEAAQTLWEMTNWRENAEDKEQTGNVIPHTPENGAVEDTHARLPVCTPERGDTGESATGTPHIPEGGETGEKKTTPSKQESLRRDAAGNGDSDDQRRRCAPPSLEIADTEEPAVLSPLSSDSETGDRRSCSEGDCCIVSVGTQATGSDRSLQALESVQQELKSVNERADRALLQLKRRYGQLRKPHIQKRNAIIRTIPGFWVTAFLNHPQLSAMIDDRDEDTLSYMNNLQVEDFTHIKSSCKIKFYFNSNPYFKNDVIIKEFQYSSSGRLASHSTPIQWWRGQNPSYRGKNTSTPSFFSWFSDHSFPAADRIATIIKEDLWPNPLQYYLIGEGESDDHAAEDSDPDNTDDCVVIVDDDDNDDEEEGGNENEEDDDDDDENDVHEISDNTEKHTEGTDNEDDDDDDDEDDDDDVDDDDDDDGEESVPEEMVESTVVDETDNIVVDADDSDNSSEEGGDSQ